MYLIESITFFCKSSKVEKVSSFSGKLPDKFNLDNFISF